MLTSFKKPKKKTIACPICGQWKEIPITANELIAKYCNYKPKCKKQKEMAIKLLYKPKKYDRMAINL